MLGRKLDSIRPKLYLSLRQFQSLNGLAHRNAMPFADQPRCPCTALRQDLANIAHQHIHAQTCSARYLAMRAIRIDVSFAEHHNITILQRNGYIIRRIIQDHQSQISLLRPLNCPRNSDRLD